MRELKIDLIDNATQGIKFEVTLELLEEIAELMHNCEWVSIEERFAYIKSCVTNSNNYEPEEWSENGRGLIAKNRNVTIEGK